MSFHSLTIIALIGEKDAVNAALNALGFDGENVSVPMRGDNRELTDIDGNVLATPTHVGCHWWADEATLAAIASIRNTALKNCNILVRAKDGQAPVIPELTIETTPDEPEPLGTFNAVAGDNIVVSHKEFTPGNWGWRAEMVVQSGAFEPGVRAMGIYSDAEHTQYQYTTGAFVWEAGLARWVTEWNEANPAKTDIHFAVLYASLQETRGTLAASDDAAVAYMRFGIPQEAPAGATWVDSGATYQGILAAGVFNVSDTAPFLAGQQIRIGTVESSVTSIWTPGAPGVLQFPVGQTTALQAVANGTMIEIWQ